MLAPSTMNTIRKHNTPAPPKPPAKPHKAAKVSEPAEPQEPQLPSLPKSVDWDAIQEVIEKELGSKCSEIIDLDVKLLPDLTINEIIWVDNEDPSVEGNEITSFTDGTVAYAKILIENKGSFDVQASFEMSFSKGQKDLQRTYESSVVDGYALINLPAGQVTAVTTPSEKYPSVSFISGGLASFNGEWNVAISIRNIEASNPNEQDFWESEALIFEDDTNIVNIATPPSLSIISFTSSDLDIKEGQGVTFTITMANTGGAAANGTLKLLQSGVTLTTYEFAIEGALSASSSGEITFYRDFSAPDPYDGPITLTLAIDRYSVVPSLALQDSMEDDTKELTLDVDGTPQVGDNPDSEENSSMMPIILGGSFFLVVAGAGAFYFMRRGGDAEDLDPFGASEQPPAMAPPVSEQPPPAAPPVPEQPLAAVPPAAAPPVSEQPPAAAPPVPEQPPAAVPPAAAPEPSLLTITVPPGTQPGQQIQIKAPDGRIVAVTVPAGLQEGSQFQIKI